MKNLCKIISVVMAAVLMAFCAVPAFAGSDDPAKGTIIEVGTYPQSLVTDDALIERLNGLNSEFHDTQEEYHYSSIFYLEGQYSRSALLLSEVTLDGVRYRGIILKGYARYEVQMAKYELDKTYWFRYDPIKWVVIDSNEGLCAAVNILDNAMGPSGFWTGKESFSMGEEEVHNYSKFAGRNWLRQIFVPKAFSQEDISHLVDNVVYPDNGYDHRVYDKVYIPDYDEVRNARYFADNGARKAVATDYATAIGIGNNWLTRTYCEEERNGGNSAPYPGYFYVNDKGEATFFTASGSVPGPGDYVGLRPIIKWHTHATNLSVSCTEDQKCPVCSKTLIKAPGHELHAGDCCFCSYSMYNGNAFHDFFAMVKAFFESIGNFFINLFKTITGNH